jgi:hypothetical protein
LLKTLRDWKCVRPLKSVWFGVLEGLAKTIRDIRMADIDGGIDATAPEVLASSASRRP